MGASVSSGTDAQPTASFVLGPDVRVLDPETLHRRRPWIGPVRSARARRAESARLLQGQGEDRLHVQDRRRGADVDPGRPCDRSRPTGRFGFSGRGSVCINTGGEKVFPEEVEEVLKLHPEVRDAVAVGIPDERFGQAVTAVVELVRRLRARRGRSHRAHEVPPRGIQSTAPRSVRRIDRAGSVRARSTTRGTRQRPPSGH